MGTGHIVTVVFWSGKNPGFWVAAAAVLLLFGLVTGGRPDMMLASNQGSLWELPFLCWAERGLEDRAAELERVPSTL